VSDGVPAEVEVELEAGGDVDDVLRAVVAALAADHDATWAGILSLENGELVLGPEAGEPGRARRIGVPVSYEDVVVGELAADGALDSRVLESVAERIATHVLLGRDTGGEAWEP
jgi:hypothetical protein